MSEPFVGEIKMFAGNFAPRGYAFCDGQLLAVSQNDALFSLLGTIYGGDGRTTFGLPDMRGRLPVHQGQGPGLSSRRLGAKGGAENTTLRVDQLPPHSHAFVGSASTVGVTDTAAGGVRASGGSIPGYRAVAAPSATMRAETIGNTGGSASHSNLMPSQCVHFIIALVGIYPSRQ